MARVPNRITTLRATDMERVQVQVREREREPRGDGIGRASRGPRIVAAGGMDRWARAPVGGIAAGASGTVTFLSDSSTATAKNKWENSAVPSGSVKCLVGYDDTGELVVKVWDCPSA